MNSRKDVCLLAAFLIVSATFALAQGTYTQLDVPGADRTTPFGINAAGDVVGFSSDASGYHGFLLHAGVFTTLDCPGVQDTFAYGINDVGQIVGGCTTGGFLYDISTQTFTTLQYSPGTRTIAYAINNAGIIVGQVWGGSRTPMAFEFDGTTYTLLQPPDATYASLTAINNIGRALMQAYSNDDLTYRYYLLIDGNLKRLERSASLSPWGLNDLNEIVGYYETPNRWAGFVLQGASRQSVRFPGTKFTIAHGINNAGVVVGHFGNEGHGFIWTPPADAAKK